MVVVGVILVLLLSASVEPLLVPTIVSLVTLGHTMVVVKLLQEEAVKLILHHPATILVYNSPTVTAVRFIMIVFCAFHLVLAVHLNSVVSLVHLMDRTKQNVLSLTGLLIVSYALSPSV